VTRPPRTATSAHPPPTESVPDDAPPGFRRDTFLPFSRPSIGDEEVAAVVETLRSGWLSAGPRTEAFEGEFRRYTAAPAALALNSCTAGLHAALLALDIGPGDEVVTTPMTFAATVNVIEHTGARPVLADVEPDTLNLSPPAVEAALTPRTRAILPVHYAGHPADLDPLRALARARGLALVEDAAHALAARYHGRRIGSGENPAAFSFYATKNVTTGEGGMLTGSAGLVERARVIGFHGMSRGAWSRHCAGGGWQYEVTLPGFKYNMSDVQASLGLCQLRRLDELQARRREIVALYQRAFAVEEALEPPVERDGVEHAWHLYVLRIRPEALRIGRDRVVEELARRNVGTSVHFIPVHLQPYYRDRYGYRPDDFPVAMDGYARMLSLPLYPDLTDADAADVVAAVLDVVRTYRR
jgi:dTDP-4-amino-4,6-dideoxygalactose transaminase